jgi:predicted transcriptional regulator
MIALPHSTREQARLAYLTGMRVTQIAEDMGVKRVTVSQWAKRGRWAETRRAAFERRIAAVNSTVEDVTKRNILLHFEHINGLIAAQIDALAEIPLKDTHSLVEVAKALKILDDIARRNLGLSEEEQWPAPAHFHLPECAAPSPGKVLELEARKS